VYLEREMKNRWTNISPYLTQLSRNFSLAEDKEVFFKQSAGHLISMLRTIQANGVFIILEPEEENKTHPTFYLRDYDPSLDSGYDNKDLYLIAGSADLARKLETPLERGWRYNLTLTENNRDFYDKPYAKASLSENPNLLGYWSTPFRLFPEDIQIITYTMPFFDADNRLQGVIGVEISVNYLKSFLTEVKSNSRNSLGYLIAYKNNENEELKPLITASAFQQRMISNGENLTFENVDQENNVYKLENHNSREEIYAGVEKMGFYNYNTPFENEEWYLIGLMEERSLLSYVIKIEQLLWTSLFVSIIIGGLGGIFISYSFTEPITDLVKKVRENERHSAINLEPIGLYEVDQLAKAMEKANNDLVEKFAEITILSETDQLTKIYNRTKFIKELEKEIERVERYHTGLSLIMFDIDHFKQVNDNYGHAVGDETLIKLAEIVNKEIRDTDLFARWGGEEFMILCPHTDLDHSVKLAERIRVSIEEQKFKAVGHISCSFGVTEFKNSEDADDLTKRVDDALYQAKENGRNQVVEI
jgi:diguanylate cyclase (GGDEF)-like protein